MLDYSEFKIKEYDFWDLFLHVNQYPYLGRCYAWAKREDADQITGIKSGELVELFGDKYSVDGNHFYLRVAEQDDKPVRLQYHMFTIPDVGKAIEHLNNETDIRTMSSKPSTTPQGSLLQA